MQKLIHKISISFYDDGTLEILGIPDSLEVCLNVVHDLNRMFIDYHLQRMIGKQTAGKEVVEDKKVVLH